MFSKIKFPSIPIDEVTTEFAWVHDKTHFVISKHYIHFSVPPEYHVKTPEYTWVFDVENSAKVTNFHVRYENGKSIDNGPELKPHYERSLPIITDFLYFQNRLQSTQNKVADDFIVKFGLPADKFHSEVDKILSYVEKYYDARKSQIKYHKLNDKGPNERDEFLILLSEHRLFLTLKMLHGTMQDEEKDTEFMDFLAEAFTVKNKENDTLRIAPLADLLFKVEAYLTSNLKSISKL